MGRAGAQIGIVLAAAALLAVAGNTFLPRRIPWVRDWSREVESRAARRGIRVISLFRARARYRSGEALFVDARSPEEYAAGHIPRAVNLPLSALQDRIGEAMDLAESNRLLVVYCSARDCDDGLLLAGELREMGAARLELFVDGFDAWRKAGGPVEEGEK